MTEAQSIQSVHGGPYRWEAASVLRQKQDTKGAGEGDVEALCNAPRQSVVDQDASVGALQGESKDFALALP